MASPALRATCAAGAAVATALVAVRVATSNGDTQNPFPVVKRKMPDFLKTTPEGASVTHDVVVQDLRDSGMTLKQAKKAANSMY